MCISNVTKIKNIQNIQVMANQNKTWRVRDGTCRFITVLFPE